jgi:hypothetical protein
MRLEAIAKALGGQLIERLNLFSPAVVKVPAAPGSSVGLILLRIRFEGSMVVLQVGAVDTGTLTVEKVLVE